MRIAGAFGRSRSLALVDTATQHHEGDNVETGVLVAAACGGALGVLYVIVLAIFIASRLRKKRKNAQPDQEPRNSYDNTACDDLEKSSTGPLETQFVAEQTHEYNASSYAAWPEDVSRYATYQHYK